VKCLHAHLAYRLAGGDDPVGDWVLARLGDIGVSSAAEGATTVSAPTQSVSVAGSDGR